MPLSLRYIRYFIATVEAGKVSQAASTLGVSQSAVTEAIKALEREIGVKFFRRHPKGVSLTIEGSQFLQHARNIIAAVADATRAPRRTPSEVTGRFSLAVTYTVAGYFLPAPLARFRRMYPGVEVQLYEMSRSELERRLVNGGIDLGVILVSNLGNAEEIAAEVLIQSRRRLWLPANHPLLGRRQVSLADVAKEPYIMLTIDEADRTALRYWQRAGHRPKIAFRTSSVEAVRSLVATGAGVAILSDMVYRPWSLEGDRIEARTVADAVPTMDVGLVWKRTARLNAPAQAFRDFCHVTYNAAGAEPI